MPAPGFIIVALLIICVASSTRQARSEARQRLKRWNPIFWSAALILWAIILIPELFRHR